MKLFIETIGNGPALVLVHGWGLHGGLWGPLTDVLAENFSVVLVDLPGHGYSDKPQSLTVDTMVQSVSSALESLDQPAMVLGWSMGALVAFKLARQFPERFERLVWIAGTPSFVKRTHWSAGMDPQTLESFADGLRKDYRSTLKRFISLNGGMGTDRPLLKTMQQQAFERGEVDVSMLDQGLTILRDCDIRAALAESTMPMLMIQGSHDRLVHPDTVSAVADLRDIESLLIEGAGHAPFLTQPALVAQAVRDFSR